MLAFVGFFHFSSLLVSAVMFHASVSEQTPDTPVSLATFVLPNMSQLANRESGSAFVKE